MGPATRRVKATEPNYPRLLGLPAAFHDVADFAHAADISIADARMIRAAVTIPKEPVAGLLQDSLLLR